MITNDELAIISAKLYVPAHNGETIMDIFVSDIYDMVEELQRLRSVTNEVSELLEQSRT